MTGSTSAISSLISDANQSVSIKDKIASAIRTASAKVGVDFSYMLSKASQESGFDPNAKAKTSSATGLYQFVDQTWLRTVKNHGEKYGLGAAADKIVISADGAAKVDDPTVKKAILALRKDPALSASMAAELTNENKEALKSSVGGKIGSTELYLAHFLGAGGASEFLNAMKSNPNAKAAGLLPAAAAANSSVFYDKGGQARSLKQIYAHFAKKFENSVGEAKGVVASLEAAKPELNNYSVDMPAEGFDAGTYGKSGHVPSYRGAYIGNPSISAPFAAMVLAQMDVGDIGSSDKTSNSNDEERKKNSLRTLGLAA